VSHKSAVCSVAIFFCTFLFGIIWSRAEQLSEKNLLYSTLVKKKSRVVGASVQSSSEWWKRTCLLYGKNFCMCKKMCVFSYILYKKKIKFWTEILIKSNLIQNLKLNFKLLLLAVFFFNLMADRQLRKVNKLDFDNIAHHQKSNYNCKCRSAN
jgi:hypothetical protein